MAPPMPNPQKRMTANPARPVKRYRPGKALAEEPSSSEEDEEAETESAQEERPKSIPKAKSFPAGSAKPTGAPKAPQRPAPLRQQVEAEDEDEEGFVTEEEEEDGTSTRPPGLKQATAPVGKPAATESSSEEESEEEESSEEEDSSSSDEAPRRTLLRPTFIKKPARKDPASTSATPSTHGTAALEVQSYKTEEEEARRREMADLMIRDKLERDAAARAAGKKSWDDDDEVAPEDMVDDTDGLHPEAEYAAWKLRELKRLKRDREAIEAREKELEEIERRRNLGKEEREKEDQEHLERQKAEREDRGKAGFMQKYHHRGAFFQDELAKEGLDKRDLMGAQYVDEVKNRDALPEFMQIRDMAKLGRKGRTKYKDLRNEDTGRWGDLGDRKKGMGDFGLDERFRPDRDAGGNRGPTGANASEVGDRPRKVEGGPDGPRAMREDRGDSYRPGRRDPEDDEDRHARRRSPRRRSPSRSRSRSARRDRYDDDRSSRKRSPSPYRDRDKRRRVEAT